MRVTSLTRSRVALRQPATTRNARPSVMWGERPREPLDCSASFAPARGDARPTGPHLAITRNAPKPHGRLRWFGQRPADASPPAALTWRLAPVTGRALALRSVG